MFYCNFTVIFTLSPKYLMLVVSLKGRLYKICDRRDRRADSEKSLFVFEKIKIIKYSPQSVFKINIGIGEL